MRRDYEPVTVSEEHQTVATKAEDEDEAGMADGAQTCNLNLKL